MAIPSKYNGTLWDGAEALEAVAALSPELMLPGHGAAIAGKEINDGCLTVARALRFLDDQVVSMLNKGKWPEEILLSFEWPEEFARSKYLAPIYGHPYFVVQGILRLYHGWFDGNASHLLPSSTAEIAQEIVGLVGDPDKVLARSRTLAEEGQGQLALHLVDLVLDSGAEPHDEALEMKARLLEALANSEESFIARNIFTSSSSRLARGG